MFTPLIVGDHDACFDHDLTNWHINLNDQLTQLVQSISGVLHEQGVGSAIEHRASTFGQDALLLVGQQLFQVFRFLIVQLETFGLQLFQFRNLLVGFQGELFFGVDFVGRGNEHNVAVLTLAQTLALENDVQRLIPRYVLQAQRNIALHRITGDDIESREIGDHLQDGTNLDILEIERQFFPGVPRLRALNQLVGVFNQPFHFDNELAISLVSGVFP